MTLTPGPPSVTSCCVVRTVVTTNDAALLSHSGPLAALAVALARGKP